jgi:hypothetical protein
MRNQTGPPEHIGAVGPVSPRPDHHDRHHQAVGVEALSRMPLEQPDQRMRLQHPPPVCRARPRIPRREHPLVHGPPDRPAAAAVPRTFHGAARPAQQHPAEQMRRPELEAPLKQPTGPPVTIPPRPAAPTRRSSPVGPGTSDNRGNKGLSPDSRTVRIGPRPSSQTHNPPSTNGPDHQRQPPDDRREGGAAFVPTDRRHANPEGQRDEEEIDDGERGQHAGLDVHAPEQHGDREQREQPRTGRRSCSASSPPACPRMMSIPRKSVRNSRPSVPSRFSPADGVGGRRNAGQKGKGPRHPDQRVEKRPPVPLGGRPPRRRAKKSAAP